MSDPASRGGSGRAERRGRERTVAETRGSRTPRPRFREFGKSVRCFPGRDGMGRLPRSSSSIPLVLPRAERAGGQLPAEAPRTPRAHRGLDGSSLRVPRRQPAVTARRRAAPPSSLPAAPQNFWISFAAAAVLPSEPGAAGGGRGAVRGVVRGRLPRETPRVPGCCRPLRHAAGRCGADAPRLMPWGAGRGRVLTRSPLCSPPLPLQPLYSAHHPPPQLRVPPLLSSLTGVSLSPAKFSGR